MNEKRRQCERACFVFAVGFWNCGFICGSWAHNGEQSEAQRRVKKINSLKERLVGCFPFFEWMSISSENKTCTVFHHPHPPFGASCAVFQSSLWSKKIARIKLHQFSNTQSPPRHNLIYILMLKTIARKQLIIGIRIINWKYRFDPIINA